LSGHRNAHNYPHSRSRNPIFWLQIIENLGLKNTVFWYLLNPLVIVELSGNLHFEGDVLFFCLEHVLTARKQMEKCCCDFSIIYFCQVTSSIIITLFFQKLGWKKAIAF
jgi:hypothetical protein